jgi:hypothetical protein
MPSRSGESGHSRGGREIFKARPSLKILLDTADL